MKASSPESASAPESEMFAHFSPCALLTPCHFWMCGNISRLALLTRYHQSCTFERNLNILSVLVRRFTSQPFICVFRLFKCCNISARSCTPIITVKQLSIITLLICQKYNADFVDSIHTEAAITPKKSNSRGQCAQNTVLPF